MFDDDEKNGSLRELLVSGVFFLFVFFVVATPTIKNNFNRTTTKKEYTAVVLDNANVLTDSQESKFYNRLSSMTRKCNAFLITTKENDCMLYRDYGRIIYEKDYGLASEPVVVIVLDLKYNEVVVYSKGVSNDITAATIDNIEQNTVYDLKNGNYYECANKATDMAKNAALGNIVMTPMLKLAYILIGIVIAFLINYVIVRKQRKPKIINEMTKMWSVRLKEKRELKINRKSQDQSTNQYESI